MKNCPYCAEEIQDAAIVCKHCGRDLKAPAIPPKTTSGSPKGARGRVAVLLGLALVLLLVILARSSSQPTGDGNVVQQAMARDYALLDSNGVEIAASNYFYDSFQPPSGANCTLKGRVVGLAGGNKDFEVFLVDDDGLTNLKNGAEGRSYFSSGRTSSVTLNIGPLSPRRYHLVVSNAFSVLSAKTVQLDHLRLSCL